MNWVPIPGCQLPVQKYYVGKTLQTGNRFTTHRSRFYTLQASNKKSSAHKECRFHNKNHACVYTAKLSPQPQVRDALGFLN